MQRRVPTVQIVQLIVEIPLVPLLDRFLTCPLLCNVVHSSRVKVFDISVVAQRLRSFGPSVQKIIEILQLQFIDKVVDVRCGHWRCTCPSLCNDGCRVVQTAENCEGPVVAVLLNVVYVPVVQVDIWVRPVLGQGR